MLVVDCDGDGDVELVGIDELDDKLFIYDSNPFAIQPCMPDACLTVNGATGGFGFGPPAVGVPLRLEHVARRHDGPFFLGLARVCAVA